MQKQILEVACLPLIVITISAFGVGHYTQTLRKAKATHHWEPHAGRITQSNVDLINIGTKTRASYQFSYTYEIDRQSFTGRKVSWSNTGNPGIRLYEKGDVVTVYTNPLNPKEAVLMQGVDAWNIVQILFCGSVGIVGIWVLVKVLASVSTID